MFSRDIWHGVKKHTQLEHSGRQSGTKQWGKKPPTSVLKQPRNWGTGLRVFFVPSIRFQRRGELLGCRQGDVIEALHDVSASDPRQKEKKGTP